MGMSASQARLLTITARLTTNEYESQQITNAKMRLATRSEEASKDYIKALNSEEIKFNTYDAHGEAITEDLTASSIYQYSTLKNQYALINNYGQAVISKTDATNFENSTNLEEFLEKNDVVRIYKNETLAKNAETVRKTIDKKAEWEKVLNTYANDTQIATAYNNYVYGYTDDSGEPHIGALEEYVQAQNNYDETIAEVTEGVGYTDATNTDSAKDALDELTNKKQKYEEAATFEKWLYNVYSKDEMTSVEDKVQIQGAYNAYQGYLKAKEEFWAEAENLNLSSIEETYTYNDKSKAVWYTNLWYRLNGENSEKVKEASGGYKKNYQIMDSKNISDAEWLQYALKHGILTIEVASNKNMNSMHEDDETYKLQGIKWRSTEYSSCIDFTTDTNTQAIAKAEAEYERISKEIESKDKKYDNKLRVLDSEHEALKTEYDSVKSAMDKNIERSYTIFKS